MTSKSGETLEPSAFSISHEIIEFLDKAGEYTLHHVVHGKYTRNNYYRASVVFDGRTYVSNWLVALGDDLFPVTVNLEDAGALFESPVWVTISPSDIEADQINRIMSNYMRVKVKCALFASGSV